MRYIAIALTLLAACDTPSLPFRGAPLSRIVVDGSSFDIRVHDRRAEAIRTNSEWAPRMSTVAPRAVAAIEQASGCTVKRLRGDQAMIVADLKCKGQDVPPAPQNLSCDSNGAPYEGLGGEMTYDISCSLTSG
ncbi:hypothetical protein KO498_07300 [Lentibacter algarum]|uniref:hypothetical protein n=1 Tax=Lentibacter algarum TaxID=576131 RepID=UPI001C07922A|nr:hypothetical protein [Lentibacter algarum]MBU2981620.1 hypothetical protein [Lentibacter algarum]